MFLLRFSAIIAGLMVLASVPMSPGTFKAVCPQAQAVSDPTDEGLAALVQPQEQWAIGYCEEQNHV